MKRIIFLVIFLIGICQLNELQAQSSLAIGVRPQAMGGAYTALSNDANAVFWNPAGLRMVREGDARFMHWLFSDIDQVNINSAVVAHPLPNQMGTIGVGWTRIGAELEEGPLNRRSTMSENEIRLSYGVAVSPNLLIGATMNRTMLSSDVGSGAGLGFDIGVMVRPVRGVAWTVGFVGRNLVANMKNEALDPYYLLGMAYRLSTADRVHQFSIVGDVIAREDIDGQEGITPQFAGGLEYELNFQQFRLALRGGGGSKNISFGGGLGYGTFSIEYAVVMMHELTIGDSHRFGINLYF